MISFIWSNAFTYIFIDKVDEAYKDIQAGINFLMVNFKINIREKYITDNKCDSFMPLPHIHSTWITTNKHYFA